jgi:broad specificity phosphatase PhoE
VSTTFHLVRHAVHDIVGTVLVGRTPGVHLSSEGRSQADRLSQRFSSERIDDVQSSPRERAQETAAPIASALGLEARTCDALDELDMGEWQGRRFSDLTDDPLWQRWNAARSFTRPPRGETILAVQARMVRHVLDLRDHRRGGTFVIVSHAEPIRALLSYVLGLPIDAWARIECSPASVSTCVIDDWGAKVTRLNEVPS